MNNTIFLTADEQSLFQAVPESLREGWTVQSETLDCYESLRQIRMRISLADFKFHPGVKTILDQISAGESPDKISFEHIGPDVQKELYFTIGARGVAAFIATLLSEISKDEDIEALATLTVIRHELLTINLSATHV